MLNSDIRGYKKYKDWYRNTRSVLIKTFGKDYKLVAALISATSPRQQVKKNIKIALDIYNQFKNNPNFDEFFNNRTEFLKNYGLMHSHYNNIRTALNHNYKKKLTLSGHKVNAFYNNLIGNYHFVTLDIWMMKIFGLSDSEIPKVAKSKKKYDKYSDMLRNNAKERNLLPAELQAILWIKYKNEVGINNKTYQPIGFTQFILQAA